MTVKNSKANKHANETVSGENKVADSVLHIVRLFSLRSSEKLVLKRTRVNEVLVA